MTAGDQLETGGDWDAHASFIPKCVMKTKTFSAIMAGEGSVSSWISYFCLTQRQVRKIHASQLVSPTQ